MVPWDEVRDFAVTIAEDRLRRGALTGREFGDALDEAYRAGREAGQADCPPGGWESGL
jgi:hypothetical protein